MDALFVTIQKTAHHATCLTWILPLSPLLGSLHLTIHVKYVSGIDDADQMLLCDNCNGGYHLFCLTPELTQVPAGLWYCPSCSSAAP